MTKDTDQIIGQQYGKVCSHCKIWKPRSEFALRKDRPCGMQSKCKECTNEIKRKYRDENREKVREQGRAQYAANPEKRLASQRRWKEKYPEKMREAKKRCRQTAKGRVEANVRGHIHKAIKKGYKFKRTFDALGYTSKELMQHLEKKFLHGMSWENYGVGGWHIDHIIPNSLFNYESTEDFDFKRAWALSNLQPLWEKDNMKKGDKFEGYFQPSLSFAAPANDNNPTHSKAAA